MSVKVAVRVRPFNQREIDLNSTLVVDMNNNTTILTEPTEGKKRDFTFDYSFWSHDQFKVSETGYFEPESSKYADQKLVFDTVGVEVLDNAWKGYHCCLFAYGQTGAGKSYSMVGYGANKGIVPIACEEIFNRIAKNDNPELDYQVQFSMLEIYNEKIQDLLIGINDRPAGGLKVREHKTMGVYVEGLTKHAVENYESIDKKTEEGSRNRTIGSTAMNASSSRAHTIITIEFKQLETIDKRKTEKLSVINLVDLAGSEKLSKTGASGDRMKEGCAINKSLTILGIVIQALAEKSSGKKNIVVPYRDSALTRILQNALGGNSKTLMICALSPAENNYDETLSTLRYADQAKKIKCNAVINENEQDKLIRELKEENSKLKEFMKQFQAGGEIGFQLPNDEKTNERMRELEDQLKQNALLMAEHEKTFQEKLKEASQAEKVSSIDLNNPHLINLNEDPFLNGKVKYQINEGQTIVGKKNADPVPEIILGGLGIQNHHARLIKEDEKVYLEPIQPENSEYIFVNGNKCLEKTLLHHNDRLIFGTNSIFLVKIPDETNDNISNNQMELDWEYAQTEQMAKLNQLKKIREEELEKQREKEVELKIKNVEEKLLQEKLETEMMMKKQQEEFQQKIKELEEKMVKDQQQLQEQKQAAEQDLQKNLAQITATQEEKVKQQEIQKQQLVNQEQQKSKEKHYLEHKLAKYLPKILEVNLIAKELQRNVYLSAKLSYSYSGELEDLNMEEDKIKKLKIKIQVFNREVGAVYMWDTKKFSNRYYIIKDILDKYFETNQLQNLEKVDDPFWDPIEPQLMGQAFLKMMSLAYLMDNPSELTIVGDKGAIGTLSVNLIPTDEKGLINLGADSDETDDIIEDPSELLGRVLYCKVVVDSAVLNNNYWKDVYCEYTMQFENQNFQKFQTKKHDGLIKKIDFKYENLHKINSVTQQVIEFLKEGNLCFNIYGNEEIKSIQLKKEDSLEIQQLNLENEKQQELQIQRESVIKRKSLKLEANQQRKSLGQNNQLPTDLQQQLNKQNKNSNEKANPVKEKKKKEDCNIF